MNTTSVFTKNAVAFADGCRFIINQGGTSSSKTFSILQLLYFIALTNDNLLISVVAESMPHLKRGAMRDFFKILQAGGAYNREDHNKTDNTYRINKSTIEFFSADNEAKVRGARRDILFVNECNNVDSETVDQLLIRTKITTFFDFNPVQSFYIHEDFLQDEARMKNGAFIKSTFRDNEYLDSRIRDEIESRRDNPRFANWFRVYGDGEVGTLEGLVFPDFNIIDDLPDARERTIGVDFGFTHDPTAIVDVREHNGELFIDEVAYQTGLTNADIHKLIVALDLSPRVTVVADSSEPKSIKELEDRGVNIKPAIKGSGSVNAGIDVIKQFARINVTRRSVNVIKELRNYSFETDKSGKRTNTPIDIFNHAIDATRYAATWRRLSQARRLSGAKFHF
jgi:phage terminase large subunit